MARNETMKKKKKRRRRRSDSRKKSKGLKKGEKSVIYKQRR